MLKRRIEKIIIRVTRSVNLRGKIVVFYGLIVFLPTVLLATGAGVLALQSARTNYLVTIREAVRQSVQSIEFRKMSYDLLVIRTATDGELISRLSREHESMYEQLETVEYVDRSFLYMSKYLPGIENFRIYHTNPTLVQDGGMLWKPEHRPISGMDEAEWYEAAAASPNMLSWATAPDDPARIVITRKIMGTDQTVHGLVYMLLNYGAVFEGLFSHPFNGAGELYLVDPDDRIIASSVSDDIGRQAQDSSLRPYWHDSSDGLASDGNQLIVQSFGKDWRVAALIRMNQLEHKTKQILYLLGAGLAFFLLLSSFLILIVVKNIVRRIRKLGTRMSDISQGVFDVSVRSRDDDELGELELLFNSMSGRLGKLVEENARARAMEQELSFKALQAQINPHFIYNSLSLIRWRAMDVGDETQIRTIDALTTFYRQALDNRSNVTRVEGELAHVRAYLDIQQLRYPDRVQVEWAVEPDVLELYTIKMLLQPIVENCYQHGGIMRAMNACIRISVQRTDDTVRFEVFDNGGGIPAETLALLRDGGYRGSGNGLGLRNIRERLSLYFGEEGVFEIDSREKEWTAVAIRIPVRTERPEIRKTGETAG